MKLLFATHYTGLGGGETALLALAEGIAPAGVTPHLLVPRSGSLADRWTAHGWPVHTLPFRGATTYFIPGLWARLPTSRRIEALIRAEHIDLLHSDYHTLPYAQPAAERAGIPTVWTCMGWWFKPKPWQRGFFRRTAHIFAHSEAIKRGFLGDPPFMPSERVEVLYPGVNTRHFHPGVDGLRVRFQAGVDQSVPVVALLARFQSVKGHEVFVETARQIALQMPDVRFLVAGEDVHGVAADASYKARILASVENDPFLRDRIHYLGFRDDSERVIGAADVVVCTSDFESFGVALVEAMACGKPVVSTNHGGPAEIVVDGETGYLVPPRSPKMLAKKIIPLLRTPALRTVMGLAARRRVLAQFSAEKTAGRFLEVVGQLVSGGNAVG